MGEETNEVREWMRLRALARATGDRPGDFTACRHTDHQFEVGNREYLVLTDEEADAAAVENIWQSVWAFKAEFIIQHTGLPYEAVEMIQSFQEAKSEDAGDTLQALIEKGDGKAEFCRAAIAADGRGHFLAGYDGSEDEQGRFYIYRVN